MATSYTIPSEAGVEAKLAANATADRNRANHTGTQSADTLTDGTTVKAYTAIERTKLAGIATSATANRTDAATDALLAAKADLVAGLIPTSQIPALALVTVQPVASQAAMLALTSSQVQPGDIAVRSDGAGTFILAAPDPTQLGNWVRLNAPTDAVTTVNGQAGTVVLAKTDVGLGSVDNTADTAKPVSTAQATAIANTTIKLPVNVMTGNGTAVIGARNAVNASAGPVAVTMPTPTAVGQHMIIERSDASTVTANVITITGTIRGVANTVVTLAAAGAANEGGHYVSESLTSWAIAGSIKPKAVLDTYYDAKGAAAAVTAATLGVDRAAASWDQSRTPSPVGTYVAKGAVLSIGTGGAFDAGYIESPNVFFDPATGLLTMVYTGYTLATGNPSTVAAIGYATSPDGITWTKVGQLLGASGNAGDPDSAGATAPVIIIDSAGLYHLFYLGLTAAGYEGSPGGICHATATSLAGPWTRQGAIIQKNGPTTSWRWYNVWHPNLVFANNRWYMFFNASGSTANVERIGYATATTLNGPWTVDDVNSPVVPAFNTTDVANGDPYVWREGDHWRLDYYRADSTSTTLGAYYATTTDAAFPLGWVNRGQVTSAAGNQGAKPAPIRFNGSVYYYASYGVNIFLGIAPDVTARNATVAGLWQFTPDRSASGRPSVLVGDDVGPSLGTGTKQLAVGGSTSNAYVTLGQSTSRNLLIYWQYAATAASAIAKVETFGGSNPLQVMNNAGSLMLGGSGGSLGFYGKTPVTKPALTYSRATENAADTGLRAALVALGLVTDSTVA